jgi:putative transposase
MPRGSRLTLDNAIFHIINRGNARQDIFHDEEDFEKFLHILARYKEKLGFKMYHFCLIPNHHHFEWEIPKAGLLSKAMQGISLSYSRYNHSKYCTVGYLWQGRFKNVIVEKDNYALWLGAYIERNPQRAGLVADPKDWKWSSYRFYAYGEPLRILIAKENGTRKWVDLIDSDPYYERFGQTPIERQKNYREFVLEIDDQKMKEKLPFQDGGVVGSEEFKMKMTTIMESSGMLVKPKKRGRPPKIKN